VAIYPDKRGRGQPTGRFRVEVQLKGRRLRGRFDTLEQARIAEEEWRRRLASGDTECATQREDTRGAPKTLLQLLAKAAPLVWNGSAHGLDAEGKVRRMAAHLGDPRLCDLNTGQVDDLILWLRQQGRSPATINRYLSALHKVLKWGHAKGRAYVPVMPEFTWQDEDEGRIRWLSREEELKIVAVLQALGQPEIADFVLAAIDTGCRRSELLAATPDQLDGNWLRLWKTKNGEARSVPLTPRAKDILTRRLPWRFTKYPLRYWWDRAKERMGLAEDEEFVLHACRHTTATRLVERGVNLRVVQQFMGHKSIQTTLRYAHISDELLTEAASRLSHLDFIRVRHGVGVLAAAQGDGLELPSPDQQTQLASSSH
jgi:integrase